MTDEVQTAEIPATDAPATAAPIQADVAPAPEEPIAATEEPSFNSTLPESFREKGYLKGIDSMEALLNKFEGSQALIGKKSVVPTAESSDEDWKAFNDSLDGDNFDKLNAMRVPESYEFSDMEFPEGTDMDVMKASTDKFSEIAKGAGASNKVADAIRSEWLKYEMEQTSAHQEKLDTDFGELGKQTWGADYEAKVAELSPIFQKFMPESVRENMANVPASQLVPLMLMAEQVANAGKPDGLPSNPAGVGQSKEQAKAKFSELRKLAQRGKPEDQKIFEAYQESSRNLRNSQLQ